MAGTRVAGGDTAPQHTAIDWCRSVHNCGRRVHNPGVCCNKWYGGSQQPAHCHPTLPLQHPPPLPQPLPVIGSGNLIYVSLEIEILTFALYSGDFTASSGTKLENFMGSE